jgi:transcriptional regulator with XRE-family HTH domain
VADLTTKLNNSDLIETGDLIRQIREANNMTQYELADRAGLGEKTVSHLELGRNMKLGTFFTLVEVLGVTPNDISPSRLVANSSDSAFRMIEEKYLTLNEKQKDMVCGMMSSIIDNVLAYN